MTQPLVHKFAFAPLFSNPRGQSQAAEPRARWSSFAQMPPAFSIPRRVSTCCRRVLPRQGRIRQADCSNNLKPLRSAPKRFESRQNPGRQVWSRRFFATINYWQGIWPYRGTAVRAQGMRLRKDAFFVWRPLNRPAEYLLPKHPQPFRHTPMTYEEKVNLSVWREQLWNIFLTSHNFSRRSPECGQDTAPLTQLHWLPIENEIGYFTKNYNEMIRHIYISLCHR